MRKLRRQCGVGGLRERDYQLAAQRRNEACRKFDYNCETARYFERESRLANHFNSWISKEEEAEGGGSAGATPPARYCEVKSRSERLSRRKTDLREMLRKDEAEYRAEMKERGVKEAIADDATVEELRKKLALKRAERAEKDLYYPHNYRCFRSCGDDAGCAGGRETIPRSISITQSSHHPRHYDSERHIDACRNAQLSMEETNLRNYSSECQGRRENPENRHHGEKRHLQGHTMYGSNVESFGDAFSEQAKTTGERRHYVAQTDSVDEGANPSRNRQDANNAEALYSGKRQGSEPDRSMMFSSQAVTSERRHYGGGSGDSIRSLANTNLRQSGGGKPAAEEGEFEDDPEAEAEAEAEAELEAALEEREERDDDHYPESNCGNGFYDESEDQHRARTPEREDNWSTAGGEVNSFQNQPEKLPICFLAHTELVNRIQDLASRELQACKKQNWSEALRFRDMRNRLELQREIEVFERDDLGLDDETKRSEIAKISDRIRLMDKREAIDHQRRVYSEEARTAWQVREREDDDIMSKDERAKREILLKELEEEWSGIAAKDRERVAESPIKAAKSHLQEEMEITAAAMERATLEAATPQYHASNEDSKNSCARNKDKAGSSLIFLG